MEIILGFPKCGTTSLLSYLAAKHRGKEIIKREWIWHPLGEQIKLFIKDFGSIQNHNIHFITRNRETVLKSMYNNWAHVLPPDISYDDWLNMSNTDYNEWAKDKEARWLGYVANPIEMTDYDKLMKPWKKYGPTVHVFEDLVKDKDFPVNNRTVEDKKRIK